ncbi:unnamed protein product [Closterium sp. NIES-54]
MNAGIYAMYATSVCVEDDCYLCVPRAASVEAAALGACEYAVVGTASAEALHTFILDLGASRCFFRDCTTLTPLTAPVTVALANPSWGSIVARASTILPCPALPSGSLSGPRLPSFSTNLVSNYVLQDELVSTFTPGGERVAICTDSRTRKHLATFTQRPGSGLYALTTESAQVVVSVQVAASGQLAVSCSCRLLTHQTLLWHHRLGHPSRLGGMHSRLLVSGLPCPRSRARLCRRAFPASRGGSARLLTPPHFRRPLLLCRLSTWTCGAQPASVDRTRSATSSWLLTTTCATPQSSPCGARQISSVF